MPASMPCKYQQEAVVRPGKRRTRFACVVDADESTRPRLEGAGHKPHQDHITAKGMNSMTHYSLLHKFIPMPQAKKIPYAQRRQWRKNRKIEENSSKAADESQKQEKCDR